MKRLISILFSFIILTGSQVVGMSIHYCMGHIVDSSLIIGDDDSEGCDMMLREASETDLGHSTGCQLIEEDCCKDEFVALGADVISSGIFYTYHFSETLLPPSFTSDRLNVGADTILISPLSFRDNPFPPPDFQVLYQVFII